MLRHDPWAILAGGAATCWGAVRVQIPLLLQGGPPVGWFGWTLGAASALGIVIGWRLGARALRSSVLFATVFTVATCFAFHAWPRLLLPTLPVWLTGLGLLRERAIARIGNRIPSRGVALALASVVLLPMSVQSHARLTSFIEAHPWPEVNATRDEIRSGPQGIRVGGAYLHARRLFPENYVCLPSPAAGVNYLEELAERNDVDSIVIGPRTIGRTTFRRLASESVPRALEVIRWDDDVLVLRKMR